MTQKLVQKRSAIKHKASHQNQKKWTAQNNSSINVECPYCDSHEGFILWARFDTIGHCPECARNWVESGGTIWHF